MIYALRNRYENELMHLERFTSPGMVVVDGGANCGIYTTVAAKLVGPNGLVLSFEPGSESFHTLETNVRLNRFENVRAYRVALSDKEGEASLYHHEEGPNSFSLSPPGSTGVGSERVPTCTLARVVQEQTTAPVGLIKLDVEGTEELVMRGARRIILRSRPTIILEMNGVAAMRLGLSPTGSWQALEVLGYRFFSMTERGSLCAMHRPPAVHDIVNVVAIHDRQPPCGS